MIQTSKYSQRAPQWGELYMGTTKSKIKDFGCTITCLANFLSSQGYSETPKTVNEKLTASGGYSKNTALILWGAIQKIWPKVKFSWRGYNYSNLTVARYVYIKKLPVLVEVNGAKIGGFRHWVLFVGGGQMVDPWTGSVRSTSTYPLTGYSLLERV